MSQSVESDAPLCPADCHCATCPATIPGQACFGCGHVLPPAEKGLPVEKDATEVLRIVREELRAERQGDPSTYNVWSRVGSAIDRAENRVLSPADGSQS